MYRKKCYDCGKMVKDKFILGFLHICLSEEERRMKRQWEYQNLQAVRNQMGSWR